MDFENIVEEYDRRRSDETVVVRNETFKTVYLAPASDTVPDDGLLEYVTFESIYDFKTTPDRAVVMVRADQLDLIKCCIGAAVFLEVTFAVMQGVPASEYGQLFEEVTWRLDKFAYSPFVTELRLAIDLDNQVKAQTRSVYDDEKSRYTRKNGGVKEHKGFDVHRSDRAEDEPEDLVL